MRASLLLALTVVIGGCAPTPPAAHPSSRPTPSELVVEPGATSAAGEAEAARLFREAQAAFRAGNAAEARETAAEIVASYPGAPVSGRALLLEARAALGSGAFGAADSAAARYSGLLPPGDARAGEAELLRAQARDSLGDTAGALESLLRVGSESPREVIVQAVATGRAITGKLQEWALVGIAHQVQRGTPLAPVVSARYAALLQARGDTTRARTWAQEAIESGAVGPDSAAAVAVLRGEVPPGTIPSEVRLGLVLPSTGPPTIRQVGALIAEGVEVAVSSAQQQGVRVQVDTIDDGGEPTMALTAVQDLENTGALGAIGFLEQPTLSAAGGGRSGAFPLVSPTARLGAAAPRGIYSLESANPEAARSIARYASAAAIRRVAIIHSRAPQSVAEAQAFQATADSLGLPVVGSFAYDVGATSFQDQILAAADSLREMEIASLNLDQDDTLHAEQLTPVALFLPVPPEDIEYLAPQVTFYGLDTLAVQILGTSGWTDSQVLQSVDPRHTDGVVATAYVDAGAVSEGYARFRAAYEAHFRRSLVSPIPALGYDAALVLLNAIEQGAGTPAEVQGALEHVRDLRGATGILSVENGQLVRRTHVVRLDHGALVPLLGDGS